MAIPSLDCSTDELKRRTISSARLSSRRSVQMQKNSTSRPGRCMAMWLHRTGTEAPSFLRRANSMAGGILPVWAPSAIASRAISRRLGGRINVTRSLPIASSAVYPRMDSLALFQYVMLPSARKPCTPTLGTSSKSVRSRSSLSRKASSARLRLEVSRTTETTPSFAPVVWSVTNVIEASAQMYSPSLVRRRYSTGPALPVAAAASMAAVKRERSSGWTNSAGWWPTSSAGSYPNRSRDAPET